MQRVTSYDQYGEILGTKEVNDKAELGDEVCKALRNDGLCIVTNEHQAWIPTNIGPIKNEYMRFWDEERDGEL